VSIQKINHIGIAVHSLDKSIPFYRDVLGFAFLGREKVELEQVEVAFFQVGESLIELLTPTSPTSPIAKHLETRGEGFHHIAYEVDQIRDELSELSKKGVSLIHLSPKPGAHQTEIAFLHPASTGKVLTELCQTLSYGGVTDAEKN
jgi:methylmalonyl-CoA/ethylmalonyl-CoA epimerase